MPYKRYDPLNNQLPQNNVGLPLRCTIQSWLHCVLHQRPHILLHTNHLQLLPPDCGDVPLILSPPGIYLELLHAEKLLSILTWLFQPVISHSPPVSLPNLVLSTDRLMSYLVISITIFWAPTSLMTATDKLMIDLFTSKEAIRFSCAPPSALTATSPWCCPSFYTTLNWRSKSPLHSYEGKEGKPVKF